MDSGGGKDVAAAWGGILPSLFRSWTAVGRIR